MGASQRRKGHNFEREIARAMRVIFPTARRQVQTSIYDKRKLPDVIAGPYSIECKCCKRVNVPAALRQAVEEATTHTPVVVFKQDREEIYAALPFKAFCSLLEHVYGRHELSSLSDTPELPEE